MNFYAPISLGTVQGACTGCSAVLLDFYELHTVSASPIGRGLLSECRCGAVSSDLRNHLEEALQDYLDNHYDEFLIPGEAEALMDGLVILDDDLSALMYGAEKDAVQAAEVLAFRWALCEYHAQIRGSEILREYEAY